MTDSMGDDEKSTNFVYNSVRAHNEYQGKPTFYVSSTLHLSLYVLLSILSLGVFPIICTWYPQLFTIVARKKLPAFKSTFTQSIYVLLKNEEGVFSEEKIFFSPWSEKEGKVSIAYFDYRKNRYVYNLESGTFERRIWRLNNDLDQYFKFPNLPSLSTNESEQYLNLHGPNTVDIPKQHLLVRLWHQVAHPIFIFQVASVILWFYEDYVIYSMIIVGTTIVSLLYELYTSVKNENYLRSLVHCCQTVKVYRNGGLELMDSSEVVVGDILAVESGEKAIADMVLITGEAVMDESSVTGESHPIAKATLKPNEAGMYEYIPEKHKLNTLFSGSTVIQSKGSQTIASNEKNCLEGKCLAVVLSTGYSTTKGELFRQILYPKKFKFKFQRDSYYFLFILSCFALVMLIISVIDGINNGQSWWLKLIQSLDLFTTAVPASLPLVITVGINFSQFRLRANEIYRYLIHNANVATSFNNELKNSINSERINVAGKINKMAFDKTGTLTEDHLEFHSAIPMNNSLKILENPIKDIQRSLNLERIMATCHGLSVLNDEVIGFSVDKQMFKVTGWTIHQHKDLLQGKIEEKYADLVIEPPKRFNASKERMNNSAVVILKRFEFDPHIARSSTVSMDIDSKAVYVCTKGSSESIEKICHPNSIPPDFKDAVCRYSSQGLYVLACCYKSLAISEIEAIKISRSMAEKDMIFSGFLLLSNPLKPCSMESMQTLINSNIDTIMITGDSVYTGVSIAKDLGMLNDVLIIDAENCTLPDEESIKQTKWQLMSCVAGSDQFQWFPYTLGYDAEHDKYDFALTGTALQAIIKDGYDLSTLAYLMDKTKVYARTSPDQKTWIVEYLMKKGHFVGMCGDGMNDCGALKRAHVGIAFSNSDASMVSPFTSQKQVVSDVVELIKEGRCSLETSFVAFKFMILYPIIETILQATLYHFDASMSDYEFIVIDMFYALALSISMLRTKPAKNLKKTFPPSSLFNLSFISSLLGQVAIFLSFFASSIYLLYKQPWFCPVSEVHRYMDVEEGSFTPRPDRPLEQCFILRSDDLYHYSSGNYETTVIWFFASLQLIGVAIALNTNNVYRAPSYTNIGFFVASFTTMCMAVVMLLTPSHQNVLSHALYLYDKGMPMTFRLLLLFLYIVYFFLSICWEKVVVGKLIPKIQAQVRNALKESGEEREEKRRRGGSGGPWTMVELSSSSNSSSGELSLKGR